MSISVPTRNLLHMSIGLALIFLAFFSQTNIEETVLDDRSKTDSSIPSNAGYISQTIIYGTFLFSNLIAPPLVAILRCRWSLVLGSATYTLLMANFLVLNTPFLYIASALEGFGSAILWTSVGHYLALNSTEKNVERNSSILWMWHTSGLIFGGIFLLVVFGSADDGEVIDEGQTRLIYGVFTGICLVGNVVFALLPTPESEREYYEERHGSYKQELISTFKLAITVDSILFSFTSAFAGQLMSFWSGVYSTSLSFSRHSFAVNSKTLVAMNSIAVGVGQIGAAAAFGLYGKRTLRWGRAPIIVFSCIIGVIAYVLAALNLPADAPFNNGTTEPTVIQPPSITIALICGCIFGIVDAAVNTQIYSLASVMWREATPQAFAISKFFHSLLSTVCMYYGSVLEIEWQLALLIAGAIISTVTFVIVERRFISSTSREERKADYVEME
ncbi:hypothetical protein PRIPAC_76480 [Pristionchus pacificus]|uniref:UNC93-like protein MFSD11 n=1 Tax=Pristionchus pacificus TaxID=54126 RepID=A0A2A6CF10_PRIPA|nr:hypothetical protein PRIPAC_76480 [Pristionchus pacificus]|eukprot:PDM76696.1 membrane transporter [Pristionchus pacificus]